MFKVQQHNCYIDLVQPQYGSGNAFNKKIEKDKFYK